MTELAYMVREDWAQHGTAMTDQSAVIPEAGLASPPYLFFAPDLRKHHLENDADQEFLSFVAPDPATRHVLDLSDLRMRSADGQMASSATVIHPFKEHDCERLRQVINAETVSRIFVIVWAPSDRVRIMLDALGAANLHTGERSTPSDALQRHAARLMADEQYNGLSSGRGKDVVIQLLRAFRDDGYSLEERSWLHALYAEGWHVCVGETVAKFIREMNAGMKHRARQRFVPEILGLLREEVAGASTS